MKRILHLILLNLDRVAANYLTKHSYLHHIVLYAWLPL